MTRIVVVIIVLAVSACAKPPVEYRPVPGKINAIKSLINRNYELKHSIPNRCWMSFPGSSSTQPWSIKCACARALLPVIAT
jgi:hypothetical protein